MPLRDDTVKRASAISGEGASAVYFDCRDLRDSACYAATHAPAYAATPDYAARPHCLAPPFRFYIIAT